MCDRFFKFFYLIGICILCICCNKNAPDKIGQFDMSLLWGKLEFVYGDTTQINNNILLVPFKGNCSLCIVDIQKYDDLFSRYLSENVKLYFFAIDSDNVLIEYLAESLNIKNSIIGVSNSDANNYSILREGYIYYVDIDGNVYVFDNINKKIIGKINSFLNTTDRQK